MYINSRALDARQNNPGRIAGTAIAVGERRHPNIRTSLQQAAQTQARARARAPTTAVYYAIIGFQLFKPTVFLPARVRANVQCAAPSLNFMPRIAVPHDP